MGDIKFRAWDKEQNKMLLPDKWDWDWYLCNEYGVLSFPVMIARDYVMSYQTKKELILMQYTGLKDKNGVEIYEGDIISFDSNTSIVFYNSSHCAFMLADGGARGRGYLRLGQLSSLDIEVIGNIYEHKHLLGGDYE